MLTYGIFLFFDIFFIIHAKGLAHVPEEQMENTELMPLGMAKELDENEYPSFELCLSDNWDSPLVAQHKQWLKTIRHETPNPKIPFKVAVYIRYFNQTKYDDYLERNKEVFRATLAQYPMWEFVGFYIDNGSTAPNMESAVAWSELLSDCDEGKVNLIITQKISNVSRKIHEVSICARMLAARNPPVGIYFISEDMYTLASYYSHNAEGKLVINPDEAPTVRLIFYMYLSGYSSSHIARTLEELGKTTYLGNTKWTSGAVIQVLRNERHCGDVLTRKTWTPDVISHKSKKNRGERQQSLYKDDHEAIISRDDFIAVQHMINNAKYGGKSILPELRVIGSGLLKGYVTISPKWAGFKAMDYLQASMSVYKDEDEYYGQSQEADATFEVSAGDFDLRGFEVTNAALFDTNKRPYVVLQNKKIKFSTDCVRRFGKDNKVELLIHPGLRKLAVRRAAKDCRHFVQWSRSDDGKYYTKDIPCSAFGDTLFELLDWGTEYKFKAYGRYIEGDGESVFLFDLSEPEIFIQSYLMTGTDTPAGGRGDLSPLSISGKRIRAVPKKLADRFGSDFYSHRLASSSMEPQSEDAWKLWLEGQLFETGEKLQVTGFDEMHRFIIEQLSSAKPKEEMPANEREERSTCLSES